jgi:hypothetical protein
MVLAFFDPVLTSTRVTVTIMWGTIKRGVSENDEGKGENKDGPDEQHGRSQWKLVVTGRILEVGWGF